MTSTRKKTFPISVQPYVLTLVVLLLVSGRLAGQQSTIPVPDNLVTEGIPPLPSELVNQVKAYTEARGASIVEWHPSNQAMLITTRFANTNQLHLVEFPRGARKQLTFFDEPVSSATFEPANGSYFLFQRDAGGNEFAQIYRYEFDTKKITLLTDGGRSQNGNIVWNNKGDAISYASTKRNGQDRDIYLMNPLDPSKEKRISENAGGGWGVADWSPDDRTVLLQEYLSVNESRIYLLEVATGTKTRLLPAKDERTTYNAIGFSKDGKGIYLTTTKDSEFERLAYLDLASKKITPLTTSISWDVEDAELSEDGKQLAFVTNENGLSKLYLLDTSTRKFSPVQQLPSGVIGGLEWKKNSDALGFTMVSHNSSADAYEYVLASKEIKRWTESEVGGIDLSTVPVPELITWKSFDGKTISGYLYKASSAFTGKRPVIINIHGGPEGQSRPTFLSRWNYFLNELGVSLIFPNVRGSTGYGKTFVDLDNGMKREESVKDIGALLDWIGTQPALDKDRIMVTGGSYGGYMTLAVAYLYSDKIRCSLDVVGISNFNTFMKNTEAYRRDLRRVEYGDERDPKMAAYFESIAPLNHADKIRKPLFIVQGGNDPRVPYTESLQMKEKITQSGGTVWFLMAKDEGHGFRKKNNADFQFYSTIAFVQRFLLDGSRVMD